MAQVTMRHYISGGRADGSDWPHPGGVLTCSEQEARALVAGQNADWHDGAEPAPDAPEPAAAAPDATDADDDAQEPDDGPEDDGDGSQPRVRDPKEVWEQYAITVHGADVNTVRSMSKSDLIGQYRNQAPA